MKHCETCKHWEPSKEWDVQLAELRECKAIKPKWEIEDNISNSVSNNKYNWDSNSDFNTEYKKAAEVVFSKAKAVVNDGSQYIAVLLTRRDFGCVLHEEQK